MSKKGVKKYTIIEGNLLEYPIFSMERRRVNAIKEEYVWREKDLKGNTIAERKFVVSSTQGIPNAFDLDVFNAIMRVYSKQETDKKNEVYFTVYEIASELELSIGGRQIDRIKQSLKRMAHTTLLFENTFFEQKERVTKVVHLVVGLEYYEKQKGKRLINAVKVVLDDELISSIERNYFKLIDFNLYVSLSPGLPRRLYEYLEKKKYRKDRFEINIRGLAQRIPLKTRKMSQLKDLLKKANAALQDKGVIDSWKFEKENVVYWFKKSEQFKEVTRDLFHLENLVKVFYKGLGQSKISKDWISQGIAVLQGLIDEGYSKEEVECALGWATDNVKGIHSIKILPKVIGQALGDKESRTLIDQRQEVERENKLKEEQNLNILKL